jgi:hypothetical protein
MVPLPGFWQVWIVLLPPSALTIPAALEARNPISMAHTIMAKFFRRFIFVLLLLPALTGLAAGLLGRTTIRPAIGFDWAV